MFVYKQYDQEALDRQYNNRLHVSDYADYLNKWELLSRQTEKKLPVVKDLRYGRLERERLDIYPSREARSKILIFIHGGYWQMLDKSMFQFIADGFHSYPVTTVLINYPLAPETSIDQMVLSCSHAVQWVYHNAPAFNADRDEIYIAGHSAGGHLAAMLMVSGWGTGATGFPKNLLKGVCTASGLFNLVPVHFSYVNKVIKMDLETATSNSPVLLQPLNVCPLIVAVGEAETVEFQAQSEAFYTSWKSKGVEIELLQIPAVNHYSIADTMVDPQAVLHQSLLQLMKLR